jgi:hypothetical protein
MHRIFLGMAVWAAAFLAAELALGLVLARAAPPLKATLFPWHLIGGVFTGIFVCVLHVMVMFHFIGSGKEMKEAIEVLGGDAEVVRRLRRFKKEVFPLATFSPLVVGASVILGGGAHTGALPGWVHWGLGLLGIALNLRAFPVEYRALVANLELLREVDERIRREISPGLYRE